MVRIISSARTEAQPAYFNQTFALDHWICDIVFTFDRLSEQAQKLIANLEEVHHIH
jgi:hypothetical protein